MAPHSPSGDQPWLADDFILPQWPLAAAGCCKPGHWWHWDDSGMAKVAGKSHE